jgi:hypothetical protein
MYFNSGSGAAPAMAKNCGSVSATLLGLFNSGHPSNLLKENYDSLSLSGSNTGL